MTFHLANKPALLLASGGVALVAAWVWATWESGVPAPPAARAPGVAGVSSTPGGPQTPEYARLRELADSTRANGARASGGSSVPTPPELRPLADGAPPAGAPPAADPATGRAAPAQTPPAAPAPDETERWAAEFARAMQDQARQLVEFRKRFEPEPTRMVAFEDVKGQRERADAQKRAEEGSAEARAARPRDRRGVLQPGDILFAVLQTAIHSDEPGPVRAKIVGERFEDAIVLGGLRAFPPAVGSRPERVLVKFDYLTTADRTTYRIDAFAIDLATARTALASDVDHHVLERWGSLAGGELPGRVRQRRAGQPFDHHRGTARQRRDAYPRTISTTRTSSGKPWERSASGWAMRSPKTSSGPTRSRSIPARGWAS